METTLVSNENMGLFSIYITYKCVKHLNRMMIYFSFPCFNCLTACLETCLDVRMNFENFLKNWNVTPLLGNFEGE